MSIGLLLNVCPVVDFAKGLHPVDVHAFCRYILCIVVRLGQTKSLPLREYLYESRLGYGKNVRNHINILLFMLGCLQRSTNILGTGIVSDCNNLAPVWRKTCIKY